MFLLAIMKGIKIKFRLYSSHCVKTYQKDIKEAFASLFYMKNPAMPKTAKKKKQLLQNLNQTLYPTLYIKVGALK